MAKRGLLNSTAITPPAVAGAAPPPTAGQGPAQTAALSPDQQPNVSQQEQGEYDELMQMAYSMLYNDTDVLMKALGSAGDPVQGLANVVANTMSRLIDSATKQGKKFPPETVLAAGAEVLEDLADLMNETGMHDFTEEEMETATYLATEMYRSFQQDSGNIDPNEAAADLENLKTAENDGTIENIFPGAGEKFGGGAAEPAAAPPGAGAAPRGLVG